jgi:hypothetical protein
MYLDQREALLITRGVVCALAAVLIEPTAGGFRKCRECGNP